jgi:hypothetical protein
MIHRLKVKEWNKIDHINGKRIARVATLISDKIDFKAKAVRKGII